MSVPEETKFYLMQALLAGLPDACMLSPSGAPLGPVALAETLERYADALLERTKPYAVAGLRLESPSIPAVPGDGLEVRSESFAAILQDLAKVRAELSPGRDPDEALTDLCEAMADAHEHDLDDADLLYRDLIRLAARVVAYAELVRAELPQGVTR